MMQDNCRRFKGLTSVECLLLVSGILILLTGNFSNIDLMMADAMFDRSLRQFDWQAYRLTAEPACLAFPVC